MIGQVAGYRGKPIPGVKLSFFRQPERRVPPLPRPVRPPTDKPVATATSDEEGIFMVGLQPSLPYVVSVEHRRFGKHQLLIKPTCDVGALKFFVTKEGVKLAAN